jgi:geranylgeranyl diphosphate synthase type I
MAVGPGVEAYDLRQRVDKALSGFLTGQLPVLEAVAEDLHPVADAATQFLAEGGKRLRPAFCYWGWRGAGGGDTDEIVAAAACLELLHACALIHDDVMDRSDVRRGRPSVHRHFSALHRVEGWQGNPEPFGMSAAILLGDLCLIWSEQMYNTSGLAPDVLARGRAVYDGMRVELMGGQYLDLLEQALGGRSTLERALRVARFKSGGYTIEHPLLLGGTLAGLPEPLRGCYRGFGRPLGEAFQLRDDVLGVFGDATATGKPTGDDLREGKRTALVAATLERATPGQQAVVRRHLGDPLLGDEGIDELREVITSSGGLAEVERLIEELTLDALAALAAGPVDPEARSVLTDLAYAATARLR